MAKNKRLELVKFGQLEIVERDIPAAPDGGLVVKTSFAGVCHSDVHMSTGNNVRKDFALPRVLGHEISGTIHTIGQTAKKEYPDLQVGDRVVLYPWHSCMNCYYCKSDHTGCINDIPETAVKGAKNNRMGIGTDGGYQQYVVTEYAQNAIRVPDGVPLDVAAIMTCSGITSYSGLQKLRDGVEAALRIKGKATIGFFGMGGLALWGLQLVRQMYPGKLTLVGVDIVEDKLVDAKAAGADVTHCWSRDAPAEDAARGLMAAVGGRLDAAVDYTGFGTTIDRILHSLGIDGTCVVIGLSGKSLPSDVPLAFFVRRAITLRGSIVGNVEQLKAVMKLVMEGKVKPPPIQHIRLEEVDQTMELLRQSKQRGRAVVKF